jgi:hypothetical protein
MTEFPYHKPSETSMWTSRAIQRSYTGWPGGFRRLFSDVWLESGIEARAYKVGVVGDEHHSINKTQGAMAMRCHRTAQGYSPLQESHG